ncbi:MAG: hypothetical protein IJ426_05420 [Clostridia bacterium]|nr:hypothetical protein [Clostridia bacterium]
MELSSNKNNTSPTASANNALPKYYFQYGNNKLAPGTTTAKLRDYHLTYCSKHLLGPKKIAYGEISRKKTGETFMIQVINTGTKICQFKDAEIYQISLKYIEKENAQVELFDAAGKETLSRTSDRGDITVMLGEATKSVDASDETVIDEDVVEWEDIEYDEYEYDGYYKYVKRKVRRESPIEVERTVHIEGYKVWEKGDCTITVHGDWNITEISIRITPELEPPSAANLAVDRVKHGFLVARCVFCFTSIFSLLGIVGMLLDRSDLLNSISAICLFLGWFSTLFACPKQLFKVCKKVTNVFFMIGAFIFWPIGIITGAVGIAVSILLCLFGASFVAIPYFFTTLKNEL